MISSYQFLLLAGIIASLTLWIRLGRREPRLVFVYVGALLGAFTGAKIVYLLAEGWLFWDSPQRWLIWATGKTILGALLGGYAGVEIAKKAVGYARATGDLFALVAPVGIVLGRVGCLLHGCCLGRECAPAWWTLRDVLGVARWPAVPVEIGFNLFALAVFLTMRRVQVLPGQHFHLYLIAYGAFRFAHEWLRDTPRVFFGMTAYHVAALACIGLGSWGFAKRRLVVPGLGGFSSAMPSSRVLPFLLLITLPAMAEPTDISSALEAIRERNSVPALAAAAMKDGELTAFGATGARKVGEPAQVTTNDLWHIGSCTKSMTATLAGILVDEGKARWEMKIVDALPELRGVLHKDWRDVTLEQLLTHRSGASKQPDAETWSLAWQRKGPELAQRMTLVRGVVKRGTEAPAGTKFIYSNQGYTIAGAMLERLAGKPYDELIREKLFAPLGMKSVGFGGPGSNQPHGHTSVRGALKASAPDADNPPAITPAGRVHCSIADFARFAQWHARGPMNDVKLMSDATFRKLHTAPAGGTYAMGWGVLTRPWAGGEALTHSGSNTMWYAVMWIAPARQAAWVAVTNVAGAAGAKACDEAVSELIRNAP